MRDIFFVFAWELSFVFNYFASEIQEFMVFWHTGVTRMARPWSNDNPHLAFFKKKHLTIWFILM